MNHLRPFGLFAALSMAGCQLLPPFADAPAAPPAMNVAVPPPVEASEITPENAREKLRQLHEEIERDQQGQP